MGRPRKTLEPVVMVEAPSKIDEAPPANIITNTRKGFTLHLGDGRKLAFGESAEVESYLVETLKAAIDG